MKNYVIRKFRDKFGLFEVNKGVWTMRASIKQGKGAVAWLLRMATTLALLIALLLPGSAIAQPQVETIWRFEVTTGWVGDGAEDNPNRPLVADEYALSKWGDIVGQPSENLRPDPNLYNIQAEATGAVLNDIEADNGYLVMWSEEISTDNLIQAQKLYDVLKNSDREEDVVAREAAARILEKADKPTKKGKDKGGVPSANEFGQLRSFLARNGVSQAQITEVIGTGAQGRSRGEIAELLRVWMKEFSKAD